uniref:G protein-coupled receptor kinase n=1 Tax=Macrostomum lignano TaxID=282301 RepID=A0A1I8FBT3_9PLAT
PLRAYLSGDPFQALSRQHRYLQWNWIEKQPVTKHTFRMYACLERRASAKFAPASCAARASSTRARSWRRSVLRKRGGEKMAINEKRKFCRRLIRDLCVCYALGKPGLRIRDQGCRCACAHIMNGGDLKFHIHNMTYSRSRRLTGQGRGSSGGFEEAKGPWHSVTCASRPWPGRGSGGGRLSERAKVGTVGYMAPEVVKGERYSFPVDWFGLGCIIYEMLCGQAPFRKRKSELNAKKSMRRVEDSADEGPDLLPGALLAKSPTTALAAGPAADLKSHAFLRTINWKRLEAGVETLRSVRPDPHAVYAKDAFNSMTRTRFFTVASTLVRSSIPFQQEIIETECFDDLDVYYNAEAAWLTR